MAGIERDAQYKTRIFEQLFESRGGATRLAVEPEKALVTLDDVRAQVADYSARTGIPGGPKNVAAFFKDFVRNMDSANRYWPASVHDAGYTARQVTGRGACFTFELLADGQKAPFRKFEPSEATRSMAIEISVAAVPRGITQFADSSDRWFSALCASLAIVEKHFAAVSGARHRFDIDETFLGIRGKYAAIDRLYVGRGSGPSDRLWLMPTEVKYKDDIYDVQMASLARELQESSVILGLRERGCNFVEVIPLAIKWLQRRSTKMGNYQALTGNQIYVVQFETISMTEAPPMHPKVAAESVFNIVD